MPHSDHRLFKKFITGSHRFFSQTGLFLSVWPRALVVAMFHHLSTNTNSGFTRGDWGT